MEPESLRNREAINMWPLGGQEPNNKESHHSSCESACVGSPFAVNLEAMKVLASIASILLILCGLASAQRARQTAPVASARTITIVTEPQTIVWIDEIRRGVTNDSGTLGSLKLSAGTHTARVRAMDFKEVSMPISAGQRGEVRVPLVR